jgi:DNA-binding GntR family transcriptional regulator
VAAGEPWGAEQIASDLRAAIARGEPPRGARLPSEDKLALQYGVTRPTVNAALRILRAEGLVRTERGRGTVVAEIPVIHRHAMTRYTRHERERGPNRGAFDAEIRKMGLTPSVSVEVRTAEASPEIAEGLQLPPGAPVVIRERKMYADGIPVQFATSYIPAEIAEGTRIAEVDSGPRHHLPVRRTGICAGTHHRDGPPAAALAGGTRVPAAGQRPGGAGDPAHRVDRRGQAGGVRRQRRASVAVATGLRMATGLTAPDLAHDHGSFPAVPR